MEQRSDGFWYNKLEVRHTRVLTPKGLGRELNFLKESSIKEVGNVEKIIENVSQQDFSLTQKELQVEV